MQQRPSPLRLGTRVFSTAAPAVMAIINRTPDSFYAPGRFTELDDALAALDRCIDQGADIVDVGGVRAGQDGPWVGEAEEITRVRPFLAAARQRHPGTLFSLDTWRAGVARACAGLIDLVNDTWAGADPQLLRVAAEQHVGYVVSHTGGLAPRTDPVGVHYGDDSDAAVVQAVRTGLLDGAARALAAGLSPDQVVLDATLDFGKTTAHSLALVRHTDELAGLGHPLMMAISRKDFVGETLDLPVDQRLEGSLAATAVAAWQGAILFRAHDVQATRRVVDMVASIRGDRPPARAERGV
ncbi:dihydropteroate synthase [Propionibacterium freudenreichii]|uniref:dihydropteroate synthase n=1 Tax=Propionibacterium freudenreichii TaxID=1744 RepID=UPI00254A35DE|nr:dihydropteroate synthase [Propionibacterium freudenreichii]MDK9626442.1 dihydropteroate synthase [Propionibacterium freudenreichii]